MDKQIKKLGMKIVGLSAVMLVTFVFVNDAVADKNIWNPGGDPENPNEYANSANWSLGFYPTEKSSGDSNPVINAAGDDRAILSTNVGTWDRHTYTIKGGELDILSGGNLRIANPNAGYNQITGSDGTAGKLNLKGGTFTFAGNSPDDDSLDLGTGGETGVINVESGTFNADRNLYLGISGDTDSPGHGEINIYGGTVNLGYGRVVLDKQGDGSTSGLFYVRGSGAKKISGARKWVQNKNGMVKFGIDDEGVTPIEVVSGKGDPHGSHNVIFEDGATLDVGFTEDSKRIGSWDVMVWEGELTDNGLQFADSVDKNVWSFEFVDTKGDGSPGTLRVSSVPGRAALIESVKELTGKAPPKAVDSMVTVLESGKLEARQAAIAELEEMGPEAGEALSSTAAEPVLEVMLKDPGLTRQSLQALAAVGLAEKAVPDLIDIVLSGNRVPQLESVIPLKRVGLQVVDSLDIIDSSGTEFDRGPAELEACDHFIRFVEDGAHVTLLLDCEPEEQNYLTVKVWGNSGASGSRLLFRDPENGGTFELSKQRIAAPVPGRFFYATRLIPRNMTDGNSTVRLKLLYRGSEPGLDVYNVYTHQESFFEPPADELQGVPFELGPPRQREVGQASAEEHYEHWKSEANRGVRRALGVQLYGGVWDERIEKGEVPEWTRGAFLARGGGFPSGPYAELEGEIHRWGSWLIRQADSGLPAFRFLEVFARAYQEEWSEFYQDEEMLERIVAALDFYVRAQGAGGGWQGRALPGRDVNWPTWLGGPDRSNFRPGLEIHQRYLYKALHMIYEDLDAAGLLDVAIDHDLDPETSKISRREAYAEMAERSIGLYEAQIHARPIANQVIYNYVPLYMIWKTIRDVNPERAASEERMIELAEIATGVRRHPRWGSYMYSPRGMPHEGGYDGSYGGGGLQLVELAELTGFSALKESARDVFEAYAHFVYLDNDRDGHRVLRNTEWISWRVRIGFPGRIRYFLSEYAARDLQIPAAIRYYEVFEEHNPESAADIPIHDRDTSLRVYENLGRLNFGHMPGLSHRIMNPIDWLKIAKEDQEGEEVWYANLPPTDYRLPDEREEDNAFVDERRGLVALRHGDARMFAILNYHGRGVRGDWVDGRPSNILRLRYTTPVKDRLVSAATSMHTPGRPLDLSTMHYGPYFVVMNGSEEESFDYQVPDHMRGEMATDLLTGERQKLEDAVIPPASSKVFVLDAET